MKSSKNSWSVASKESPIGNRIDYTIDPEKSEETVFISYKINFATLYITMYKGNVNSFVGTRMGEPFYFRNKYDSKKDQANFRDAEKIVKEVREIFGIEKILEKYDLEVLTNCFPKAEYKKDIGELYCADDSDLFNFLGIEKASQIRNFFLD